MSYYYNDVYFILVTMTTVGYGDINIESEIGRIFNILLILIVIIIIPK